MSKRRDYIMWRLFEDVIVIEFFTSSNFVRSDRSRSELPLTAFVAIKYLLMYTQRPLPLASTCKI